MNESENSQQLFLRGITARDIAEPLVSFDDRLQTSESEIMRQAPFFLVCSLDAVSLVNRLKHICSTY